MDKLKQSIILRGICQAIQSMNMPDFQSLKNLFDVVGFNITITPKSKE